MSELKKVKVLVDSLTSEGEHIKAGDVENILEEDYDKLIGLKNVRDYDEELDGEAEEADESVFEEMIETLEGEKTTLEEKVTALEGEKTTLEEKVTALEGEKTTLEGGEALANLKKMLDEAINLPKGQKPTGYEG